MTEETPEYGTSKSSDAPQPPDYKIRADLARLAMTAAATGDIRTYLNGLRLIPRAAGGVYIFGSDGRAMLGAIDSSGYVSRECVIAPPRELLRAAPRPARDLGLPRNPTYLAPATARTPSGGPDSIGMSLTDAQGRPLATAWSRTFRGQRIDERKLFLDRDSSWFDPLKVVGDLDQLCAPEPHTINQHLLTRTTAEFSSSRNVGIALWQSRKAKGATGKVFVQFLDAPSLILAIMPLAGHDAASIEKTAALWNHGRTKVQ